MIAYLNINHFENKVINFREICHQAPTDIICVDETKLNSSYPDSQFPIDGYQFPPFGRDRNKYVGGKIAYVREGFIAKRLIYLEVNTHKTICIEVKISKKRCINFVHRPPHSNNKKVFFSELTTSLNHATIKYYNIVVMGDLNIDTPKRLKLIPINTYLIYVILFP